MLNNLILMSFLLTGVLSLTIPLNNLVYAQDSSITNTPLANQRISILQSPQIGDVTKMHRKQRIIYSQRTQSL